jgi:hypothetical protein
MAEKEIENETPSKYYEYLQVYEFPSRRTNSRGEEYNAICPYMEEYAPCFIPVGRTNRFHLSGNRTLFQSSSDSEFRKQKKKKEE